MKDRLEPFILFREKASKLLNSTFARKMAEPTGVDISWNEQGQVAVHRGPDQEAVDAYLLTFRFFIQGNESISFKNMGEHFREIDCEDYFFLKFEEARMALNKFLDGDTNFNVNGFVSRRKLMQTFIYGDLGHANNTDKRQQFNSWMEHELLAELMKNEFKIIIVRVLHVVAFVDKLCKEVLESETS